MMLLPHKLEMLLEADGPEKFRAKPGLSIAQKKMLHEFDAEYFEYNDEHLITNYQDLE